VISFRNKADIPASIAIIGSMVLLVVTLGCIFLPAPKPKMTSGQVLKQKTIIESDIRRAEESVQTAKGQVARYTWQGSPQEVAPTIFARVTAISQERKLTLSAIRPAKTADVSGLVQLPFQVAVSGHFPDVAAMFREMETPTEKLSVDLVQITAGETGTDQVVATIGASAFLQAPQNTPVAPPNMQQRTTTTTTTTTP